MTVLEKHAKSHNPQEALSSLSNRPEQLRQKRSIQMTFAFLSVLLLVIVAVSLWAWFGNIEESITGVGQLVPEGKLRRIMAPYGGIVTQVYVRENQRVRAGQILIGVDTETNQLNTHGLEEQLRILEQESQALQAAVSQNDSQSLPSGSVQDAWLQATRQEYRAQLAEANLLISRAEHNYQEAQEKVKQVQNILVTGEKLLEQYRSLYQDGGISLKDLQEYEQKIDAQRGELAFQQQAVNVARMELENSRLKPAELQGHYRRDILERLSDHQRNIAQIRTEMDKAKLQIKQQTIVSPMDGVINEQVVRGPGDVISPGQVLLSVVPEKTPLVAEVKVSNTDLSYVHLKQRAALRIDALPYQHFGRLFGTVEAISPSTQQDQDSKTGPFYVITIKPEKSVLTSQGKQYPLRSGMTLTADIITRKKNILSFFTEPLNFHLDKAFRDPTNR